jgi:hypothetical protein
MSQRIWKHLVAGLVVAVAIPATAAGNCNRSCLGGLLEQYLHAVVSHDAAAAPLAAGFRQTENAIAMPLGAGTWQSITALGKLQRHYLDPVTHSAGYYGTIVEGADRGIATLRLRVDGRRIAEAEWVIARKDTGTPQANGPGSTSVAGAELSPPPDTVQPVKSRLSREALIALANGYFDNLQAGDRRLFNAHSGWLRIENGIGTGEGAGGMERGPVEKPYIGGAGGPGPPPVATVAPGTCGSICAVVARRYPLVDEAAGVVLAMVIFQRPPGSALRRNLLTEWFAVNDGKVRGIYAAMHYLPPAVAAPNWPPYDGNLPAGVTP